MKSLFSVLMFLSLSVVSFAKPLFTLSTSGTNILISKAEWANSKLEISILDLNGQVIFNRQYNSPKSSGVKLNVGQLAPGNYEVVLSNQFKTESQAFSKSASEITLAKDVKTFYKPQVRITDGVALINFLNLDNTSTLKILDPANQTIYSEEITAAQYSKRINLNKVGTGEFTISITQGENEYWYNVNVK